MGFSVVVLTFIHCLSVQKDSVRSAASGLWVLVGLHYIKSRSPSALVNTYNLMSPLRDPEAIESSNKGSVTFRRQGFGNSWLTGKAHSSLCLLLIWPGDSGAGWVKVWPNARVLPLGGHIVPGQSSFFQCFVVPLVRRMLPFNEYGGDAWALKIGISMVWLSSKQP